MDVYKASRGPFRKKMHKRKDRRKFSKSATSTRKENVSASPMRLGIRL